MLKRLAKTRRKAEGDSEKEHGAAIVEFVLCIPMLICLVAAMIDAAYYIRYQIEVDSATSAATRYLMDYPLRLPSDDDRSSADLDGLKEYLADTYPALFKSTWEGGNCLSISVDAGDVEYPDGDGNHYAGYEHKIYLGDQFYSRQNSARAEQDVIVTITYKTKFPTLIGSLISSDGSLTAKASEHGILDRTGGSTW